MHDDGLPPLREVIAQYGLKARRRFGQNFILNLDVTRRIARAAGDLTDSPIVEIGAGPGGLTRALLAEGAREVIALEADARFIPALEDIKAVYPKRLRIISGDATATPLADITDTPCRVVANLPYNIATALLIFWLRNGWKDGVWKPDFRSLTLMFQKEVAQRITATPDSRAYGRLGVLTGWLTEARILFDIDRQNFVPPPDITSAVVHLTPRPAPLAEADMGALEALTAALFGQRRKMLRGGLKQICSNPEAVLTATGIDGSRRAETLSIEALCALARHIGGHTR